MSHILAQLALVLLILALLVFLTASYAIYTAVCRHGDAIMLALSKCPDAAQYLVDTGEILADMSKRFGPKADNTIVRAQTPVGQPEWWGTVVAKSDPITIKYGNYSYECRVAGLGTTYPVWYYQHACGCVVSSSRKKQLGQLAESGCSCGTTDS